MVVTLVNVSTIVEGIDISGMIEKNSKVNVNGKMTRCMGTSEIHDYSFKVAEPPLLCTPKSH